MCSIGCRKFDDNSKFNFKRVIYILYKGFGIDVIKCRINSIQVALSFSSQ
jgi:hypothetical protein